MTLETETKELIHRAQAGDPGAFEELVDRYYAPVFGLLCKWTGHWQDAEDLTQDTFLRAYKYIKSFNAGRSFKNWIYRIALNLANDRYAASQRRPPSVELDDSITESIEAPDDAAEKARQHQLLRNVYRIIPELTTRERSVFVLKAMEGMDNSEIARLLGITETTVRRFYGLARKRILDRIEHDLPKGSSNE